MSISPLEQEPTTTPTSRPPPPPQHEADATQLHSALNILESDSIVSLKPPASQGTQPQPSQNHKGRAGTLDRRRVCVYKRLSSVAQNDRRKPTTRWTTNAWVDLCCRRNSDSPSDITKTQAHKGTRESTPCKDAIHTHTHTVICRISYTHDCVHYSNSSEY